MKKLKVWETFAGIGAQNKAIKNLKGEYANKIEVVATTEWDARAIIAYNSIHHKNKNIDKILSQNQINSEKDLNSYLNKFVFSLDSKKPTKNITSKSLNFKKILAYSNLVNNNYPDITKVTGKQLEIISPDILTYSFPCQGLSIANMGRSKGISLEVDSTSNLIWQIHRILNESSFRPKYLLLEKNIKIHYKD